ncbi:22030_t:CDS:2 [Gigaspora rosea]|nr:22030_t:CDS:2 [Gigaspora rosea]
MIFTNSKKKENVNTLPIKENLPTEDPWKIFEETVIDSGQALGYNPNDGLSDKWELDSDEESLYLVISRNKEPPTYHIKDLIDTRLNQILQLLKLRVNQLRLNKVLFILNDIQHFLYPNPHPLLQPK